MGQTVETNSMEVRWFEAGSPPASLSEWVTGFGPVETSTRTDLYFSPPDPSFNLKLRSEGGEFIELKQRLGSPRPHTFGPDVTGRLEQWYKWSFSLDHTPSPWSADRTGLWLPVTKTRTLSVLDGARLESIDDGLSALDVTVHVEVTEVSALSETAWTCGLEAAGPPENLERVVSTVGSELFGAGFPLSLSAEQSVGYVTWLRGLVSDVTASDDVLVSPDEPHD